MKNRITFYPTPLPDEHILGTLARWHTMLGAQPFLMSISEITSNTSAINPSSIWRIIYKDLFCIYEKQLTAEEFLRHTLWHYYFPFHNEIVPLLLNNESVGTSKLVPADQIRIKRARNWRWCHVCAHEDIGLYGTTYWHASHQAPSMIHCQKHGNKLIHKCDRCRFTSIDFAKLLLPPAENKCPICKGTFETTPITNPIVRWIDRISTKLIFASKGNAIPDIKIALIEKAELPNLSDRIFGQNARQSNKVQFAFDAFLRRNGIPDIYFQLSLKNNDLRSPHLSVPTVLYSDRFLPPLYYLLLMKFLIEDDSEIEKILLGQEHFYA